MDEYEQLCLWEEYKPKVNDYVIWDKGEYGSDEGWVYFYDDEYITIETGVKPKPKETLDCKSTNHHKMIHTLLLCPKPFWYQLKYVTSRTPHEQIQHYSECDD
tara:strand:+ start:347 stop:655 length:309 start_codon:yes stop_codon:yes gene_type:complete